MSAKPANGRHKWILQVEKLSDGRNLTYFADVYSGFSWGILLADIVGHLENAGHDRDEVLKGMEAELLNPTDTPRPMVIS